MRFVHREDEQDVLNLLYRQADSGARMVVMTGRRRVGKTLLALKHVEDKPHLYLFVAKKSERMLCQEYCRQIQMLFPDAIVGEITQFKDIFALLMKLAKTQKFVLVIDEFQEFFNINAAVYSDCQQIWDLNKADAKCEIIFIGSVYSLMHKIFQNSKEPLFGRADRIIHLRPFAPHEITDILLSHGQSSVDVLFDYYVFTGGVPKYMDMFISNDAYTTDDIINMIFSAGSPLLEEGKNVLIEDFGKDYGTYFSILELISIGKTGRADIESVLQRDIGGYLERLDRDYAIIRKLKPIGAKPNSKIQKYHIRDHFLRFWFRFIYRNRTAVETANFDCIKAIVYRDLSTYRGKLLESMYYDVFAASKKYNTIGSYWGRDGHNEIDLVAVNELEKTLHIAEIKLNKQKIDRRKLEEKSNKVLALYPGFDVTYLSLSLADINDYLLSG